MIHHEAPIGRASELALLARWLEEVRCVAITGPPAIGKSAVAAAAVADRPHAWVDLAGASSAEDVVARLLVALDLPPTRAGQLGGALARRGPLVLVLDGVDRAQDAVRELVPAWLEAAANLGVITTGLGRARLPAERALEILPLAPEAAAELFVRRASLVRPATVVDDPAALAAVVERLDRHPYAITLAAARTSVMSARQMLARMDDRFRLLRGGIGRHGSLAEAIAWALAFVDDADREVLRQCAIFCGGFRVEDAEAVVQADDVLGSIEVLRARSLLQRHGERLSMLESVREYLLAETGAHEALALRHARHFVATGDVMERARGGPDEHLALARLTEDRENLLAVVRRCSDHPELVARAAISLQILFMSRGPLDVATLDAGVAAATRHGDAVLLARALRGRAIVAAERGLHIHAREDVEAALRSTELSAEQEAELHTVSARIAIYAGDLDRARRDLARAANRIGRSGSPFLRAFAANLVGMVELAAGRYEASASAFAEARAGFRASGSLRMMGVASSNLAVVRAELGRLQDARTLLEEALSCLETVGDRAARADALVKLGPLHLALGRIDLAAATLEEGLAAERTLGNVRFEAIALGNLALVAHARGELRAARSTLQQALDLLEPTGDRHVRTQLLTHMGAVEAALGQQEEARADFAAARSEAHDPTVLDIVEGFLDLGEARLDPGRAPDWVARAEARLVAPPVSPDARIAHRLLSSALAGHSGLEPTRVREEPAPSERNPGLTIGPDAAWFEGPDGLRVDLTRRGPMRSILLGLAEQRHFAPGVGLDAERIFALGWPGQRALPQAAATRVYNAIRQLRVLGLDAILKRTAEGYLLDPEIDLSRAR